MAAPKKRKLSGLTQEDTTVLLTALETFQSTLDENDEDLPPELVPALDKLRAKLGVVQHTSFSKVDPFTLVAAQIRSGPLFLSFHLRDEIEAIGKADRPTSFLSFDATVELIKLVRNHVSVVTGAGCRILINIILLRLASTMRNETSEVNIIPEFPISKTTFGTTSGSRSFSGVVDFLLASVPPKYSRFLLQNPVGALANPTAIDWPLTPTIIEAKKDNLPAAVPQAAMAVASYCKQHELPVLRGCITSGEQWSFFVYKGGDASRQISIADQISLGANLENLSLVLGLLKDLVENALVHDQKYFSY
ncbi:hypothetical protein F5887DRAFT_1281371 [Amanita rubescens]|nr:hypothetical protein F5887DRAFT_1281371 [Amanita rubescens]